MNKQAHFTSFYNPECYLDNNTDDHTDNNTDNKPNKHKHTHHRIIFTKKINNKTITEYFPRTDTQKTPDQVNDNILNANFEIFQNLSKKERVLIFHQKKTFLKTFKYLNN